MCSDMDAKFDDVGIENFLELQTLVQWRRLHILDLFLS